MGLRVANTWNGSGKASRLRPHGHLPLLHRLQQGRLGLRWGPVDLVAEDEVVKDGAGREAHGATATLAVFLQDVGPGDVGGQEVGRELDAAEREVERLRQGRDEQRLREAGRRPRRAGRAPRVEEGRRSISSITSSTAPHDPDGDLSPQKCEGLGALRLARQLSSSRTSPIHGPPRPHRPRRRHRGSRGVSRGWGWAPAWAIEQAVSHAAHAVSKRPGSCHPRPCRLETGHRARWLHLYARRPLCDQRARPAHAGRRGPGACHGRRGGRETGAGAGPGPLGGAAVGLRGGRLRRAPRRARAARIRSSSPERALAKAREMKRSPSHRRGVGRRRGNLSRLAPPGALRDAPRGGRVRRIRRLARPRPAGRRARAVPVVGLRRGLRVHPAMTKATSMLHG